MSGSAVSDADRWRLHQAKRVIVAGERLGLDPMTLSDDEVEQVRRKIVTDTDDIDREVEARDWSER